MKTVFQSYIILLIALLAPTILFSQSEFKVSTTIRPRFEFRDGYKSLKQEGDDPAAFVSQRSRLRIDFKNELVQTRFTIYDYRVWGDQVWKQDGGSAGIHEAWASIKLNTNARLVLGRQSFQYDNGRLVSAVNWNQVGAAHDAARYIYSKNNFNIELLTAWNQNKENTTGTDYIYDGASAALFYKNLNILWVNKKLNNAELSFLTILDGYEETKEIEDELTNDPNNLNYRYTTGFIYKQKIGKLAFKAQGYYQGGKLCPGTKTSAYYLNLESTYKFSKKTNIQIGFEMLSGTDHSDETNTSCNAFDILYGARHKFNGRIDYFSVPSTTKEAGLVNPFAKFNYSFKKDAKLTLAYHLFYLHKDYLPATEAPPIKVDKYLGQEVDITFKKKFNNYMSITGGYSVIFGSNTLEMVKGGDKDKLNNWAFVMLTINPTLFTHKNE